MTDEIAWRGRIETQISGFKSDVVTTSDRLTRVETKSLVDEVHRVNVEKRLTNIEDVLKRLVWLILAGIIGGILTFIMTGGLNVG